TVRRRTHRAAARPRRERGDLVPSSWVSRLSWWTGRAAQARTAAVRAVEGLESLPPGRQLAMAYSHISPLHILANEDEPAVEWGRRALSWRAGLVTWPARRRSGPRGAACTRAPRPCPAATLRRRRPRHCRSSTASVPHRRRSGYGP